MKNFIFKSQEDFHKIVFNKLEIIQSELRHQRLDHVLFKTLVNKLFIELNLQKQADSYYNEKLDPDVKELDNIQTDLDEQ